MSKYITIPSGSNVHNPTFNLPPLVTPETRLTSHQSGLSGEQYASDLLVKCGYIPQKCRKSDFKVINPGTGETLKLEVKTAQKRRDGRFVFHILNDRTDYRQSDFLLLFCIQKSGYPIAFVIPTDAFEKRSTIVIGSDPVRYVGMWSQYRIALDKFTLERTRQ